MLLSLPPQVLIILAFCLILALTFHEFGHAYTAHLCGDDTAKAAGRMSLNPLVHLDLFGSLMVLIVGLDMLVRYRLIQIITESAMLIFILPQLVH